MESRRKKVIDIRSPQKSMATFQKKKDNIKVEKVLKKKRKSLLKSIAFITALLSIVVLGALHIVFSRGTIFLWPVSRSLALQETVKVQSAAKEIDVSQRVIPAKVLEQEKTLTKLYPASGSVIKESKAQGVLQVFNTQPKTQVLIAGTRFISQDGKLFHSKQRVSIPTGSSQSVTLVAAESGGEYNIPPSSFSLPGLVGSALYTLVYGKSSQPMAGGTKTAASVITESDIRGAQTNVEQDAIKFAEDEIFKSAIPPFVVDRKSLDIQIIDSFSSVKSGAEFSHFNATAKVKVSALIFRSDDLERLMIQLATQGLKEHETLHEQSVYVTYQAFSFRSESYELGLNVKIDAKAYQDIPVDDIERDIQGLKKNKAEEVVRSFVSVAQVKIDLWPFWTQSLPGRREKIYIHVVLD